MASSEKIDLTKLSESDLDKLMDKKYTYKRSDTTTVELPLGKALFGNMLEGNFIYEIIKEIIEGNTSDALLSLGLDLIPDITLSFPIDNPTAADQLEITIGTIANLFILVRTQVSKLLTRIVPKLYISLNNAIEQIKSTLQEKGIDIPDIGIDIKFDSMFLKSYNEIQTEFLQLASMEGRINTIFQIISQIFSPIKNILEKVSNDNTVSFFGLDIITLFFETLETNPDIIYSSSLNFLSFISAIDSYGLMPDVMYYDKMMGESLEGEVSGGFLLSALENKTLNITTFQNFLVVLDGLNTLTTNLISDESPFLTKLILLSEEAIKLTTTVLTDQADKILENSSNIFLISGGLPPGMSLFDYTNEIYKNNNTEVEIDIDKYDNDTERLSNSLLEFITTLRYIYKEGKPPIPSTFSFSGYSSISNFSEKYRPLYQNSFQYDDELLQYIIDEQTSDPDNPYENLDIDKLSYEIWNQFRTNTKDAILNNPTIPAAIWGCLTAESNYEHGAFRKINVDKTTDPDNPLIPINQGSSSKILAASKLYLLDNDTEYTKVPITADHKGHHVDWEQAPVDGGKSIEPPTVVETKTESNYSNFKEMIQEGYELHLRDRKYKWTGDTPICDQSDDSIILINEDGSINPSIQTGTYDSTDSTDKTWITDIQTEYSDELKEGEFTPEPQEILWNKDESLLKLPLDSDIWKEARIRTTHDIYGLYEFSSNDYMTKKLQFEPLDYYEENGPPTIGHALSFRTNIFPNLYAIYDDILTKIGVQDPNERRIYNSSEKLPVNTLTEMLPESIKSQFVSPLPNEIGEILTDIIYDIKFNSSTDTTKTEVFLYPSGNDVAKYYSYGNSDEVEYDITKVVERNYLTHYKSCVKHLGLLQKRPGYMPTLFGINIGNQWLIKTESQLSHENRAPVLEYASEKEHYYFEEKNTTSYKRISLETFEISKTLTRDLLPTSKFKLDSDIRKLILENIIESESRKYSLDPQVNDIIDIDLNSGIANFIERYIIRVPLIKEILNGLYSIYTNNNPLWIDIKNKTRDSVTFEDDGNGGAALLENSEIINDVAEKLVDTDILFLSLLGSKPKLVNNLDLDLLTKNKSKFLASTGSYEYAIGSDLINILKTGGKFTNPIASKNILYTLYQFCRKVTLAELASAELNCLLKNMSTFVNHITSLHPTAVSSAVSQTCPPPHTPSPPHAHVDDEEVYIMLLGSGVISNDFKQCVTVKMIKSMLSDTISGEEIRFKVSDSGDYNEDIYFVSRATGFYDLGIDHVGHTLEKYYNRYCSQPELVNNYSMVNVQSGLSYDTFDKFLANFHQKIVSNNNNKSFILNDNDGETILSQTLHPTTICPHTIENAFGVVKFFGDTEISNNIGLTDYEIIQRNSAGFPRSKSQFWSGATAMSSILATSILKETFKTSMRIGTKEEFDNWLSPRNTSLKKKCKVYPLNNYFSVLPPPFSSSRTSFTPLGELKDYGYAWGNFFSGRLITVAENEKFKSSIITSSFADLFGLWFQQPNLGYISTILAMPLYKQSTIDMINNELKKIIEGLDESTDDIEIPGSFVGFIAPLVGILEGILQEVTPSPDDAAGTQALRSREKKTIKEEKYKNIIKVLRKKDE